MNPPETDAANERFCQVLAAAIDMTAASVDPSGPQTTWAVATHTPKAAASETVRLALAVMTDEQLRLVATQPAPAQPAPRLIRWLVGSRSGEAEVTPSPSCTRQELEDYLVGLHQDDARARIADTAGSIAWRVRTEADRVELLQHATQAAQAAGLDVALIARRPEIDSIEAPVNAAVSAAPITPTIER